MINNFPPMTIGCPKYGVISWPFQPDPQRQPDDTWRQTIRHNGVDHTFEYRPGGQQQRVPHDSSLFMRCSTHAVENL